MSWPTSHAPPFAAATLCIAAFALVASASRASDDWTQPNASLAADSRVFLCEPRFVWRALRPEASCAGSYTLQAGMRVRVVGMEVPPKPESVRIQWLRDGRVFTGWVVGTPEQIVVADRPDRLFLPDLPPDDRLLDSLAGTWALEAETLRAQEGWHWLDSGELKLERGPRQGMLTGVLVYELDFQRQPGGGQDYRRELRARVDREARVVQPVEATLSGNVLTLVGGKPRVLHVGSQGFSWSTDHLVLEVAEDELRGRIWSDGQSRPPYPVRFVGLPHAASR